jgi:hypothetical protein
LRNEQTAQEYELWARNLDKTNDNAINSEYAEKAENLREEREQARH